MLLIEAIRIADAAYGDGLVQQYSDEPNGHHGDTLAKFIAVEITETFDQTVPDALAARGVVKVLEQAIRNLEDVVGAFQDIA